MYNLLKKFPVSNDMFFETPVLDQNNIFNQPFVFSTIQECQRQDLPLRQRVEAEPTKFKTLNIENATIIVRITDHDDNNNTNELTDRSAIHSDNLSLLNRSAVQNNELNIQYNKNNYNDKIYNSNRSAVDGTLRRADGDNRSAIASNIDSID